MKLKTYAILLLAFSLISAKGGCSEEKDEQAVVGKWKWVKTFCCGRTSVWTNPNTCSCTQELDIHADGTFQLRKDGKEVEQGKYLLRKGLNDFQLKEGDSALCIQFNEGYAAYVEFIGDTLLLSRGYMDFDNVYYIKNSSK
jgi:hypothetical protein